MDEIEFKFNRGLLPLTIPIKITNQAQSYSLPEIDQGQVHQQGHLQVKGQRRAIILNMSKTTV